MLDADDTIAAIATPPGKGGIAVVRVSGSRTREFADRLVRSRKPLQPRVATYGLIVDESGRAIDRGIAVLYQAPHSYTGEDTLELQIHGSPVVAREVVRALLSCGARHANAGEFTRRAFLNGKLDLHEVDAVANLIDAQTRAAARAGLANLSGGLVREVQALRAQLSAVLEELAAAIDFPDEVEEPDRGALAEQLRNIAGTLQRMQAEAEIGRIVREGISVAIVGPPNAGKSSLLNALLGEERALVSDIPGTTRDTIEESIAIDGIQIRLIDTAGIRAHADRLESAGIERTQRALAGSRIALVVLDGSAGLTGEAWELLRETQDRPRVVFANKADLGHAGARELNGTAHVTGSVRDGATLDALRAAIAREGWNGNEPDFERPHLTALHELDAVAQAVRALSDALATLERGDPSDLIAGDLNRAYAELGHLTAGDAGEALLTAIFSRFCIGK